MNREVSMAINKMLNLFNSMNSEKLITKVLETDTTEIVDISLFNSLKKILLSFSDEKDLGANLELECLKVGLYEKIPPTITFAEWSAKFDTYIRNKFGASDNIANIILERIRSEGEGNDGLER